MPTATTPRNKLLERPLTPRKGLQITPRIIGTLERIARFRFATKAQLARLDGGSEDVIARRLTDLFDHGFIDRPEKQRHGYRVGENPPITHAITRSGLQIVEDNTTLAIPHLDWTTKNRRAKPAYIEHTLATTEVVVAFLEDAQRRGLTLFDHYDLLAMFPENTRESDKPFQLKFDKTDGDAEGLIPVRPDRILAVQNPNARSNFVIEIDMGTMTIGKTNPRKAKFGRKLAAYWHAFQIDLHRTMWGFKSFRVLTVTTTDARVDTMRETAREIVGKDTNLFAFTTFERMYSATAFSPIWRTTSGDTTALWDV